MKKMRRMIPALCMLLVSAIMLSTASYAWFTMNEQVTASGMQVQAKASGNLLISTEKMTANAKDFTVNLGGTKKDLTPITLTKGATNKWQIADGQTVDPTYGDATTMKDVDPATIALADNAYFAQYVVYLATAGDEFSGKLQFDFNGIANHASAIANAYTLALYVVDTEDEISGTIAWNQPDYVYNIEDDKNEDHPDKVGNTTFIDTGVEVDIPSTYGKTTSTAVGLKVIIRLYVDGALKMPGVTETVDFIIPVAGIPAADENDELTSIDETVEINAITTYNHSTMSSYKFYTDINGTTPKALTAEHNNLTFEELGVVAYCKGDKNTISHPEATYVNNTTVPSDGTSFSVDFRVEPTTTPVDPNPTEPTETTAPEQGN